MIGERVRLAREVCGFTQKELTELSGVPLGTLGDLEAGRTMVPGEEVIQRLADVMRYPVNFFYRGALPDLPEGHFRRLKRGKSKVSRQVRAEVRHLVEIVDNAQDALKFPPVVIDAIETDLSHLDDIEAIAANVRSQLRLGSRDPIPNVTRAVERGGVVVVRLANEMEDHDGYSAWPDFGLGGRPIIALGSGNPGDRDRFTVSHELGHLVLHTARRGIEADRAELEAHRFAAAFLLPAESAKAAMRPPITLGVLKAVKATFGTSIGMNAKRAYDLRLIDKDHFVSLRKQLSARGWNKNEPVEVENERPVLIAKTIDSLAGEGSTTQRAERVGLPVFKFRVLAS